VSEPGLGRVFAANARAEWIKLQSVRSTVWALLITVALTVGLGALLCAARVSRWDRLDPAERVHFDAAGFSLNGIFLAQLAIVVLGVLVMSSEYATGQIRATFGATPQRRIVLAAKVVVFGVVVLVTGTIAALAAFEIGQSIIAAKHADVALGDPGVLRAVLFAPVYLALLGTLSIAVATIVRRTAGAIALMVGLLLVAPIIVSFLPSPWNDDIGKYLPSEAGASMFHVLRDGPSLSPGAGLAMIALYTAAGLTLATTMVRLRDA
jgi:ABC-type transport system involved in multi-copper enzyme maturation permease subunit